MPRHQGAPAGLVPGLLLALTQLFWAGNWVVGRSIYHDVPPMALSTLRWTMAVVFMLPFAWPHLARDWPRIRASWRTLLGLGILGTSLQSALTYLGLNYTTATNGVILNSFTPILIIVLSWLLHRDRLRPVQALGVLVSLTGVLCVLSRAEASVLLGMRLNVGDLFILAGLTFWALYTILLRHRPAGLHLMSFLLVTGAVGVVAALPLAAAEWASGARVAWSASSALAAVYIGLFPAFLCYVFWNRGVDAVGPNVAGLYMHLMPVFGALLSWIFLGERLRPFHLAGIALILAGIALTTRARRAVPAA